MTKFIEFIQNKTKLSDSFTLAFIYSIGYVIIAMTVVKLMTGASYFEFGLVKKKPRAPWHKCTAICFIYRTWVWFLINIEKTKGTNAMDIKLPLIKQNQKLETSNRRCRD